LHSGENRVQKKKGFVCQNCGKAVPANTGRCPHCGRFFKGVRCPKCHYVGESNDFLKGCPSCGYLGDEAVNEDISGLKKKSKKPRTLPLWFVLSSSAFLIVLIIIFVYIFFHM